MFICSFWIFLVPQYSWMVKKKGNHGLTPSLNDLGWLRLSTWASETCHGHAARTDRERRGQVNVPGSGEEEDQFGVARGRSTLAMGRFPSRHGYPKHAGGFLLGKILEMG